jgi:hypothetical protein
VTTPNVKRHAPYYVAWLTALVFVMAGCANVASTPPAAAPATTAASPADGSAGASSAGASTQPTGSPAGESATPADETEPPQAGEPPDALLAGASGGPTTGALGTFSWDGLVSDSPWIVPRKAVLVRPGDGLRIRFEPGPGQSSWAARWARIRGGEATRPHAAGSGDDGRVVVEAPTDAGDWSLQLEARFAGGGRAIWYWRVSVGG